MINMKFTRTFDTANSPVLDAHLIEEEGFALIYVKDGSETVVRKSQGAAGEVFAGFALSRNAPAAALPLVEEGITIDQAAGYTLPRLPISGQLRLVIDGADATIVAGAPAAAGEIQVAADALTFHAGDDGKSLDIYLMFEPTVTEARQYTGDAPVGGLSSIEQDHIGVFTLGDICTNMFDMSADWASAINPSLGADGQLTVGGGGVLLSNVVIIGVPSADNAFLVVRIK